MGGELLELYVCIFSKGVLKRIDLYPTNVVKAEKNIKNASIGRTTFEVETSMKYRADTANYIFRILYQYLSLKFLIFLLEM